LKSESGWGLYRDWVVARLPIRKSAIQQIENLRYSDVGYETFLVRARGLSFAA
jgi:hypothetical protein